MIIEVQLDRLSAQESFLRTHTVPKLQNLQSETTRTAQSDVPQAGESEDLRTFSGQLTGFSQTDLANMTQAMESFASSLKTMEGVYEQAQISAITRALLL